MTPRPGPHSPGRAGPAHSGPSATRPDPAKVFRGRDGQGQLLAANGGNNPAKNNTKSTMVPFCILTLYFESAIKVVYLVRFIKLQFTVSFTTVHLIPEWLKLTKNISKNVHGLVCSRAGPSRVFDQA